MRSIVLPSEPAFQSLFDWNAHRRQLLQPLRGKRNGSFNPYSTGMPTGGRRRGPSSRPPPEFQSLFDWNAHRRSRHRPGSGQSQAVSILIRLECPQEVYPVTVFASSMSSFNPYSTGMPTGGPTISLSSKPAKCFNPYSTGMPTGGVAPAPQPGHAAHVSILIRLECPQEDHQKVMMRGCEHFVSILIRLECPQEGHLRQVVTVDQHQFQSLFDWNAHRRRRPCSRSPARVCRFNPYSTGMPTGGLRGAGQVAAGVGVSILIRLECPQEEQSFGSNFWTRKCFNPYSTGMPTGGTRP